MLVQRLQVKEGNLGPGLTPPAAAACLRGLQGQAWGGYQGHSGSAKFTFTETLPIL